jgi:hypothetical protein
MLPNSCAGESFWNLTKELPVRYQETRGPRHATVDACQGNLPLHHENPPTVDGYLLDDMIESQAKGWEQLWIDIGGEG